MSHEFLFLATVESSLVLLAIWLTLRIAPAIPPNWKAWIWRLGFLKVGVSYVPFAAITLSVWPAPSTKPTGPEQSKSMAALQVLLTPADTPVLSPKGRYIPPPPDKEKDPLFEFWLLGAGATFVFGLVGRIRAGRVARKGAPAEDPCVSRNLHELFGRAGFVGQVRVTNSSEVQGAMLVGGFRPTIVLPNRARLHSDEGDIRLMLAHEAAHIVRRDLFWFAAIWTVQALLFFNPIVWLAARCARQDHESATDQLAVELADTPIQTYADMLLRTTVVTRMSLVPGTLSMAESFRNVHQRLQTMKHFHRKPSPWVKSAAVGLALIAVASVPTYVPAAVKSQQTGLQDSGSRKRGWHASGSLLISKASINETKPGNFDLDLYRSDVGNVLRQISHTAHVKFDIDPRLQGRLTLQLKNVTLSIAIENILRQVGATYKLDHGTYKIVAAVGSRLANLSLRIAPGHGMEHVFLLSPETETMTGTCKDVDVRELLTRLFTAAQRSFTIDPSVHGSVTVTLKDAPFDFAFATIARQAGAMLEVGNGRIHVFPEGAEPYPLEKVANPDGGLVSCKYERADVREVLLELFKRTQKSFRIGTDVLGPVSLSLTNVPFDIALTNVLRQVNGSFSIKNGIYEISGRPVH